MRSLALAFLLVATPALACFDRGTEIKIGSEHVIKAGSEHVFDDVVLTVRASGFSLTQGSETINVYAKEGKKGVLCISSAKIKEKCGKTLPTTRLGKVSFDAFEGYVVMVGNERKIELTHSETTTKDENGKTLRWNQLEVTGLSRKKGSEGTLRTFIARERIYGKNESRPKTLPGGAPKSWGVDMKKSDYIKTGTCAPPAAVTSGGSRDAETTTGSAH